MALPATLQFCRVQTVQEHVFIVTLARSDRLNALHNEARGCHGPPHAPAPPRLTRPPLSRSLSLRAYVQAHFELAQVWDHYEANPELWVAILTGAGDKAFSAGFGMGDATRRLRRNGAGGAAACVRVRHGHAGAVRRPCP
jgi:enoyl-CoA hydratase/carnithine racemase